MLDSIPSGGVQADVFGLEKYQPAMDNADSGMEQRNESICDLV
jgi:hypothetical protein